LVLRDLLTCFLLIERGEVLRVIRRPLPFIRMQLPIVKNRKTVIKNSLTTASRHHLERRTQIHIEMTTPILPKTFSKGIAKIRVAVDYIHRTLI
jgi:hypothetical protein